VRGAILSGGAGAWCAGAGPQHDSWHVGFGRCCASPADAEARSIVCGRTDLHGCARFVAGLLGPVAGHVGMKAMAHRRRPAGSRPAASGKGRTDRTQPSRAATQEAGRRAPLRLDHERKTNACLACDTFESPLFSTSATPRKLRLEQIAGRLEPVSHTRSFRSRRWRCLSADKETTAASPRVRRAPFGIAARGVPNVT